MAGEKQRVNLVLAGRRQAILVAFEARKLVRAERKRIAVIECSGDYKAGGAELHVRPTDDGMPLQ